MLYAVKKLCACERLEPVLQALQMQTWNARSAHNPSSQYVDRADEQSSCRRNASWEGADVTDWILIYAVLLAMMLAAGQVVHLSFVRIAEFL